MWLLYVFGFLILFGILMTLVQAIGAIIAWLLSIWWILLLILGAIIALKVWWNQRPSVIAEKKRLQTEQDLADERTHEAEKQELKRIARLRSMPTSSSPHLIGYRILRQIRMVRVDNCSTDDTADLRLKEEAEKAGATGIINLQIRPYHGGKFSAQGDAVVLEQV